MARRRLLTLVTMICLTSMLSCRGNEIGKREESNTWKIGCLTPLTGDGAAYGVATRRGLDLALDRINSAGGVNGRKLSVACEDDQMTARIATAAIQKLITVDRTPVIIGAFGSSITLAVAPIAERNKVVLFSASSTADDIKNAGDYIFRNVPPNRDQGKSAALFVLKSLKGKTASILRMNNDYGVSLGDSFRANFEAGGGKLLSSDSYNPGSTDFRAQLVKIKGESPDVVFFPGHYQESGLILKQAREIGVRSVFIGGDGSYAPELIQIAGPAAEGSYYTLMALGDSSGNPDASTFMKKFKDRYHEDPDVYSAYAYDALLMIADAIKVGGYNAEGIKKSLYGMKGFKGVTGITQFDANGEVDKPYAIYKIQGGKFQMTHL